MNHPVMKEFCILRDLHLDAYAELTPEQLRALAGEIQEAQDIEEQIQVDLKRKLRTSIERSDQLEALEDGLTLKLLDPEEACMERGREANGASDRFAKTLKRFLVNRTAA
jgi:hypothetical protein